MTDIKIKDDTDKHFITTLIHLFYHRTYISLFIALFVTNHNGLNEVNISFFISM